MGFSVFTVHDFSHIFSLCILHIEKIKFTQTISGYTFSGQTILKSNHNILKEILSTIFVAHVNKLRRIQASYRITFQNLQSDNFIVHIELISSNEEIHWGKLWTHLLQRFLFRENNLIKCWD